MPRIFDNIEEKLLPALQETLAICARADFCVGYFNMRGWRQLHGYVEKWAGGEGNCCRLLVGMQTLPAEDLRAALSLSSTPSHMDNATAQATPSTQLPSSHIFNRISSQKVVMPNSSTDVKYIL